MKHLRDARIGRVGTNGVKDDKPTVLPGLDSFEDFAQPLNKTKELQGESLYMGCKGNNNARKSRQAAKAIEGMLEANDEEVPDIVPALVVL